MKARLLALAAVGVVATATPAFAGGWHNGGSQHFVGFTFGSTRAPVQTGTATFAGPTMIAGPMLHAGPMLYAGPMFYAGPSFGVMDPSLSMGPALFAGPAPQAGGALAAALAREFAKFACTNVVGAGPLPVATNPDVSAQLANINAQIANINARLDAMGAPQAPGATSPDGVPFPGVRPRAGGGVASTTLVDAVVDTTKKLNDAVEKLKAEPTPQNQAAVAYYINQVRIAKAALTDAEKKYDEAKKANPNLP